jgi:hypothetical protein
MATVADGSLLMSWAVASSYGVLQSATSPAAISTGSPTLAWAGRSGWTAARQRRRRPRQRVDGRTGPRAPQLGGEGGAPLHTTEDCSRTGRRSPSISGECVVSSSSGTAWRNNQIDVLVDDLESLRSGLAETEDLTRQALMAYRNPG